MEGFNGSFLDLDYRWVYPELHNVAIHLKIAFEMSCETTAHGWIRKLASFQTPYKYLINNKESYMHLAAKNSNPVFCQMLKENNFDVVETLGYQIQYKFHPLESPLFVAIRHKNSETALYLIKSGASLLGADAETEFPLLPFACKQGLVDVVRILVQSGKIDINQHFGIKGLVSLSPLYITAMYGNFDIARILLENGAYVNHSLDDGNRMTAIFQCIIRGDYKMTRLFIDYGAKINILTSNGVSPLHLAAQLDLPEIVTLLLNRGANVHISRPDKRTPLHIAADYASKESFVVLMRKGAKFTLRDERGKKALLLPTVPKNPFNWIKGGNPCPDAQIKKLKEWRMKPNEIRKFNILI